MGILVYLDSIIWAVATIVFVIFEAVTAGLVTIWFALGALATTILSIYVDDPMWQIACFLIVSIISLGFTKTIKRKFLEKDLVKTNVSTVVDSLGIVTEDITSMKKGRVTVDGKDWMAAVEDTGCEVINIGETVRVKDIKGVTLIVSVIDKD